jgi:hypothetical protein
MGIADPIQVPETTSNCLRNPHNLGLQGEVWVKGKGNMLTY